MITPQQIYDATNGGLDIIKYYYPQADEKKAFRMRDERTPSARMKRFGDIWKVTDFGDDSRARNAIDICMDEENITFAQAIYTLAGRYGISDNSITEANKPEIRHRQAEKEENDGDFNFEKKDFTDRELKVLGPRVKAEHCKEYGYHSLQWYSITKKDKKTGELKTTTVRSTDTYPIFIRECSYVDENQKKDIFYKIYQPLNYDKAGRFFYKGNKPSTYINGLDELKAAAKKYESQQVENEEFFEDDEKKRKKPEKYPEAIICSGERDALCCASLGYKPLWFNSETYRLSENEYKEISKLVEVLYNVPDIDSTGIRKAIELAMAFIEIRTVWLPEWLKTYKDSRGKHRKDLRDFMELDSKIKSFRELLDLAMPMRFWELVKAKDSMRYEINSEYLIHFLKHNGFGTIENKNEKSGHSFIRVEKNIVYEVKAKDIKIFLRNFMIDRKMSIQLRNLVNNSTRISETIFETIGKMELDFRDYDYNRQFLFFNNATWDIQPDNVICHSRKTYFDSKYVWQEEVIPHDVKRIDPSFTITHDDESDTWDIEIKSKESKFFCYLINTSRIFWRDELEIRLENYSGDKQEYRDNYKFDISGPLLQDEEIEEQKLNLVNKIFTIGYLLHRHKIASRAWCVYAMDGKMTDNPNESNGRSGKSVCFKALRNFMKTVTLPGRNPKLTDNQHIYDRVTEYTDYVLIDDANQYLDFDFFFDTVTGEWIVNPKNNRSYEIPFEFAPKMAITTNFTPRSFDPSTVGRLLFCVFSDYYHEKTDENDYRETRSVRDDFGIDLFDGLYPESDWNNDINFFVDCLQFYLTTVGKSIKINPNMNNITQRTHLAIMGAHFHDWALVYFDKDGENVDRTIPKEDALLEFTKSTNTKNWTTQRFTKALKSFCRKYGYIFNPKELQNSQGRIIRKHDNKAKEMIYIQTTDQVNPEEITQQSYTGQTTPF